MGASWTVRLNPEDQIIRKPDDQKTKKPYDQIYIKYKNLQCITQRIYWANYSYICQLYLDIIGRYKGEV